MLVFEQGGNLPTSIIQAETTGATAGWNWVAPQSVETTKT